MERASSNRYYPHGERAEYQTANFEVAKIVTDTIDNILSAPNVLPGTAASNQSSDSTSRTRRGFAFMESFHGEPVPGQAYAKIQVMLDRVTNHMSDTKTYSILISPQILRVDITSRHSLPLASSYTFAFSGENLDSATMMAATYNTDTQSKHEWEKREITEYDAGQLFDTLATLNEHIDNAARKNQS